MAEYIHTFLQLATYAEDLINTEENKVDRFIDGMNLEYMEHVVAFKRPETFDDAVDRGFSAEEVALRKNADDFKRNPSYLRKGQQQKKMKGVASGSGVAKPRCNNCGKMGHASETCWRALGACLVCGSMEHRAATCPRTRQP